MAVSSKARQNHGHADILVHELLHSVLCLTPVIPVIIVIIVVKCGVWLEKSVLPCNIPTELEQNIT